LNLPLIIPKNGNNFDAHCKRLENGNDIAQAMLIWHNEQKILLDIILCLIWHSLTANSLSYFEKEAGIKGLAILLARYLHPFPIDSDITLNHLGFVPLCRHQALISRNPCLIIRETVHWITIPLIIL